MFVATFAGAGALGASESECTQVVVAESMVEAGRTWCGRHGERVYCGREVRQTIKVVDEELNKSIKVSYRTSIGRLIVVGVGGLDKIPLG